MTVNKLSIKGFLKANFLIVSFVFLEIFSISNLLYSIDVICWDADDTQRDDTLHYNKGIMENQCPKGEPRDGAIKMIINGKNVTLLKLL